MAWVGGLLARNRQVIHTIERVSSHYRQRKALIKAIDSMYVHFFAWIKTSFFHTSLSQNRP